MRPVVGDVVARPLVVTSDGDLLDELLQLADTAGVAVDCVPDLAGARGFWTTAPVVLVGDDVARAPAGLERPRLRRRSNVALVARDVDDPQVWSRAVAIGADQVCVLPDAEPWLIAAIANAGAVTSTATVIAVIGGRGGAGASSLAAALAVTAARLGDRVTFIDADPLGGGADLMFGGEGAAGARWSDLAGATGQIPAHALRSALPQVANIAVLAWDRVADRVAGARDIEADIDADVAAHVLNAARHSSDLVVADVGRGCDVVAQAVLAAADRVFIIAPAEVRAAAATARVAAAIAPFVAGGDVRLVVRGPAPSGLRASEFASAVGLPLAGELQPERGLAVALERGEAPAGRGTGPLARLCIRLLADLCVATSSGDVGRFA